MTKKIGLGTRPSEIKGRDKQLDLEEPDREEPSVYRPRVQRPVKTGGSFIKVALLGLFLAGGGVLLGSLFFSGSALKLAVDRVQLVTGGREVGLADGESVTIAFSDGLMVKRVLFKGLYRFFPPDDITVEIVGTPESVNRYAENMIPLLKPEEQTGYELLISRGSTKLGSISLVLEMKAQDWIARADAVEDKKVQAACYRKAVEIDPDAADAHVALGKLYEEENNRSGAIKEYEAAVRISPDNVSALQALKSLYERTRNTAKLLTVYDRLAQADAGKADGYYYEAGRLAEKGGASEQALSFYRKALSTNRAHSEARQRLITLYEKTGQWNRVAGNAQVLLEYEPKNANLYLYLSDAYAKMGNISGAVAAAEKAEKLQGGTASVCLQLAVLYERAKKNDKAVEYYKKAVAKDTKNAVAANNLGMLLEKQGKRAEAITYYEKAVALKPADPGFYTNLADAYEKEKKWDKAAGMYEQVVKRDSKNREAWEALAVLYMKMNSKWKAVEAYQGLAKLEPKKILWHQKMAELYEELNRLDKAKEQYKMILGIDPSNSRAKQKYVELSKRQIKGKVR